MDHQRLNAAANIARWRGWTSRHYSILEHMVIGTQILDERGASLPAQRMFLLHDMHETEVIGDVPTPDKKMFCNPLFHHACDAFDKQMYDSYGDLCRTTQYERDVVADMDDAMARIEYATLVTRVVDGMEAPTWTMLERRIKSCIIRLPLPRDGLIDAWLWHGRRLGLVNE